MEPISVVFYDPATGRILQTTQTMTGALERDSRAWLKVPYCDMEYDQTHVVQDGALVQTHRMVDTTDETGRARRVAVPIDA